MSIPPNSLLDPEQEKEFLRSAVASSTNHIILTDVSGKIIYANAAAERFTGYSRDEILGNTPRLWGGLMGKEFYEKMWHTIKDERQPFVGEIKNRRKNGEEYYAIAHISPVIQNDELVGFLGTEEDITELKKMEQQLLIDKTKDEALLQSLDDGVVLVDEHGFVLKINTATTNLLGYSAEDLLGKEFIKVVAAFTEDGAQIQDADRPLCIALRTNNKQLTKMVYQTKNGNRIVVRASDVPLIVPGQIFGVVNVLRDITRETEVDRMKTEFISLASHQLRTPLSAMKWFAEMLLNGDAGEVNQEQKKFLQNIYNSNERMIDLVNALLNISRIESGRILIDPVPTAIDQFINGIVAELKVKSDLKKQTLAVSVHPELPEVPLDPKMIREVFMNLLTNSIKYTPEGGEISLVISRRGEELLCQCSDTGLGIPEGQKQKIFTKFFRADNILHVDTDGTGLGLYLAKAIVESSGGKIWFESEEHKGTTFWFTLPIAGMQPKQGEVQING